MEILGLSIRWKIFGRKFERSFTADVSGKIRRDELFYSYCLNGCLGLVKTWLEDGEDKSPDYAADMTYRMVVSSVKAFYDKKEGREES